MPCDFDNRTAAQCAVHGLSWKTMPTVGLFGPLAAAIGPENGLANLQCTAKAGKLIDCRAMGDSLTQAGRDAMLSLAPRYAPPERTWNGQKVDGRQVIAIFDWAALNATYAPLYNDAPN
ncbi:hypothetical protein [Caulobacter endophyticus]|uniref:hypothetical protein n=1 Tax=Caulobacter endophyticus TaxID=2172652 RepID=UPI0024105A0D|nr:hypothetical protein [Caulobacter endophyticus]MDG2529981.1 hypothetical protein [Caulobacter endophyticus]